MSTDEKSAELESKFFKTAEALLDGQSEPLSKAHRRHLKECLDAIERERARSKDEIDYSGRADLLKPYVAGRSIASVQAEYGLKEVIKLASNEHAVGPSPAVLDVIRDLLDHTHRYPEVRSENLLRALGEHLGVGADQIFLGCGSNELFDTVVRVLRPLGSRAVISQASFSMYRHVMHVYGVPCVEVPILQEGQDLDALADAVVEHEASFVFLNTPHNPTGQVLVESEIRAFMERVGPRPYVLLDEAYVEFAKGHPGMVEGPGLLPDYPNMIVCRTFSKAYGLAGLRVGYGVARKEIVDLLNLVRQPFNLTRFSAPAALAALKDQDWLRETVNRNKEELVKLRAFFTEHSIETNLSGGNFLMVDLKRKAAPLCEAMVQQGIVLRSLGGYGFPNAFRMTIGTSDQTQVFMRAFDTLWNPDF